FKETSCCETGLVEASLFDPLKHYNLKENTTSVEWKIFPNENATSVEWMFILIPPYISIISALGFVLNVFVLLVFCLHKKAYTVAEIYLWNGMATYLVFLSVSDLLYTITLPVWIEQALRRDVNDGLCSTVNVIMYNSFYVGSGLLCCISVDRYLAIVYPFYFHWVREVCTAVALSTAVCILEVVLHTLLLFHMGALQGSLCLYEQHIPIKPAAALVFLVRIIVGFLIPVLIMSFCFQQIMQSLNQSVSILEEERRRVRLLLLLLLLTYIASFLPYQTVMLLRALLEPGSCKWAAQLRGAYFVTSALTTLNSALDPILYCLINTSARMEIKIFTKILIINKLFKSDLRLLKFKYQAINPTYSLEKLLESLW
uniref:G-protein coupled receptors family 1 profile domain-containing protein n=1 Tax=Oryzias sinensis TaxID=183150 RepID=A0A8C8DQR0_9TELE